MAKKKEEIVAEATQEQVDLEKVAEENAKVLDNKKYVVDRLLATKREGMEDLVDYMDEIGFFSAPCSGGNHLCCEFGLVHHTRNVIMAAENIGYALLGKVKYEEIKDSVTIAAALHDLGKCGDYGKQMYVVNMVKDGRPTKAEPEQKYKQSESKPFKRNPELLNVPHAVRSVKLATLFIDLTEDEEWAILTHDGLYDFMKYEIPNHETQLSMIIHWADMWASKVMEGSSSEGDEE